jgi:cytochrome o ubiquinol oxidase subunit 2
MPRGEGSSGQVNERQTVPDQSQGNALPGADRTPAPAQLNTRPTERHQH